MLLETDDDVRSLVADLEQDEEFDPFRYRAPGPVSLAFLNNQRDLTQFIMGPVGGGKTTVCAFKRVLAASLMPPDKKGLRRSRWVVVRTSFRDADRTVLKSWQQWFPKTYPGSSWQGGNDRPVTHVLRWRLLDGTTVEAETIFIGLGEHRITEVLRGLEISGAWLNEADTLGDDALSAVEQRVGRYPARVDLADPKAARHRQVIADLNAPDEDNWTYGAFIENAKPNRVLYAQPSGRHPDAENLGNLEPGYYENMVATQEDWFVRRFVDNKFGYKLARLSRNAHGAGHMDIMHGVTPYRGTNPASPSLRDGIIEAMSAPNVAGRWDDAKGVEFGAYLWSRRALGEWERFRRGDIPNPPDKLSEGDHALHVKEAEAANPQFVTAAAKVHAWALALWDKKLASGLITPEQHADGLKIRDYVPGLRAFDYDGDPAGAGGRGGGDARQSLVKRFQGSTRDVINPLESLMTDAYETAAAIAHNDVMKALDRLSLLAGHGGAAIAERIPAKEMRMLLVDPLEAIEATGRQGGMAAPDVIAIRDMVESLIGNEKAKIFRPAVINTKGETIVFFRDGGQLRAMRLADREFGMDIYRALTSMSAPEKNLFLDMASVSSSALRAGITSDPAFIMANLIRDQAMASIFYGSPFKRLAGTVRGMADEMLGREAARRYNAAGGIMGGQEVAALRDGSVERDLAALRRKGWLSQRLLHLNPVKFIKGAAEVTEISETGMRLGLYKSFYSEAKKRGLADHEAMMEAAWRARDHMDFGRRGSQMAAVSRLVPFLNASLQGFDKVTREMIAPFFGQAATAGEAAARGNAVKAWARLSILTVAGLGLHALMSRNEDYREISDTTRATHWMVKTGQYWTAIPKPFEMAVILNAAEAVWDAWAESDPLAASRYVDGLFNVIAPPNLFEGLPGLKFYYEAKTNTDMFTGRPIVPDDLQGMETWLQYTARTSEISKLIGGVIGQPPVMVDQFITTQFGTIGRSVMALSDMAFGDKPAQGWDEKFITRRFVKMASRGSTSSREFWDMVSTRSGELEGKAKSYKAIAQAGDDAGAADYLATLDGDQRAYVTVSMMPEGAKRLHPLIRARGAVQAIGWLRRAIADNAVRDADDNIVDIPSGDRGAADDILSDLAMVEARNALIAVGTEGWQQVKPMPTDGYIRELEAVSPLLKSVLATRYNKAKVWPRELIEGMWPDLRQRLLDDGSQADWKDLEAEAKAAGVELDGDKASRLPKPAVPGLQ